MQPFVKLSTHLELQGLSLRSHELQCHSAYTSLKVQKVDITKVRLAGLLTLLVLTITVTQLTEKFDLAKVKDLLRDIINSTTPSMSAASSVVSAHTGLSSMSQPYTSPQLSCSVIHFFSTHISNVALPLSCPGLTCSASVAPTPPTTYMLSVYWPQLSIALRIYCSHLN